MKQFAMAQWKRGRRSLASAGDYGGVANVSADSAKLAVQKAEAFLHAIGELCPELTGESF